MPDRCCNALREGISYNSATDSNKDIRVLTVRSGTSVRSAEFGVSNKSSHSLCNTIWQTSDSVPALRRITKGSQYKAGIEADISVVTDCLVHKCGHTHLLWHTLIAQPPCKLLPAEWWIISQWVIMSSSWFTALVIWQLELNSAPLWYLCSVHILRESWHKVYSSLCGINVYS